MPQKSQTKILENFCKYLEIVSHEYIAQLDAELAQYPRKKKAILKQKDQHFAHVEKLTEFLKSKAACHGFSISHATMDILGQLNIWEEILRQLVTWEGDGNLDQIITDFAGEEKTPTSRRKLFLYGMYYILISQASSDTAFKDFVFKGMDQRTLLEPNRELTTSFYEILDENALVKEIKQRRIIAGTFSREDLKNLINKKSVDQNICLIGSLGHTIRIGVKDDQWLFYDPNMDHTQDEIHITFSTKEALIDAILVAFDLDNENVAIENDDKILLSTSKKTDKDKQEDGKIFVLLEGDELYEEEVPNDDSKLLLSLDEDEVPKDDGKILLSLDEEKKDCDIQKEADLPKYSLSIEIASLSKESVIEFHHYDDLLKTNFEGLLALEGLHILAYNAPNLLNEKLIELKNMDSEKRVPIYEQLVKSLKTRDAKNISGFEMMAIYAPQVLTELFDLAENHNSSGALMEAIEDVLTTRDENLDTGMHTLLKFSPHLLKKLLEIAENDLTGAVIRSALAASLVDNTTKNNDNVLMLFAKHCPQYLAKAIELSLKAEPNYVDHLLDGLAATNHEDVSAWEFISKHSHDQKQAIIDALSNNLGLLPRDDLQQLKDNLNKALHDTRSPYRQLCKHRKNFPNMFKRQYGKTKIISTLLQKVDRLIEAAGIELANNR